MSVDSLRYLVLCGCLVNEVSFERAAVERRQGRNVARGVRDAKLFLLPGVDVAALSVGMPSGRGCCCDAARMVDVRRGCAPGADKRVPLPAMRKDACMNSSAPAVTVDGPGRQDRQAASTTDCGRAEPPTTAEAHLLLPELTAAALSGDTARNAMRRALPAEHLRVRGGELADRWWDFIAVRCHCNEDPCNVGILCNECDDAFPGLPGFDERLLATAFRDCQRSLDDIRQAAS